MPWTENSLVVIIPAYEPQAEFESYATEVSKHAARVVVVNDGSGEEYDGIFNRLKEIPNLIYLKHEVNRGKGCALKTAFSYCASELPAEAILVTADCDGQHALEDVLKVYGEAREKNDHLILGSRDFTKDNIPVKSQIGNTLFRFTYRLIYGLAVYDTQTGLRGFSIPTARAFLEVPGDRFEYEMSALIYAKRDGIPIREIPIQTIYPDDPKDRVTHYKAIRDTLKILFVVLKNAGSAGKRRTSKK